MLSTQTTPVSFARAELTSRHSAKVLIPFFLVVFVVGLGLLASFDASLRLSLPLITAATFTLFLGLAVQWNTVNSRGILQLDLRNPPSVYGLFYFAYYGLPMLMLCIGLGESISSPATVSILTLLGYTAFLVGSGLGRQKRIPDAYVAAVPLPMSLPQWIGLMVAVSTGIACVGIAIFYSITNGMFFLHDQRSKVYLSPEARFFNVISPTVESPLILLLGLAARVPDRRLSRYANLLLWGYFAVMLLVWVLSSQFRPAFAGSILFLIALGISGKMKVKLVHLAAAGLISLACLGVTRSVRELNSGFLGRSDNQLNDSLTLAQKSVESSNPLSYVVSPSTARRAAGSIRLLSEIMEANQRGYDFVYGEMFVASLGKLVPRVLWPEKDDLEPFQIQMRRYFGLEVTDDPASLLVYSYANGGGLGIAAGFCLLGWVLAKASSLASSPRKVGVWIFVAFVWTAALQIEQETFLLTLSTLRVAVCFWAVYKMAELSSELMMTKIRPSHSIKFERLTSQVTAGR